MSKNKKVIFIVIGLVIAYIAVGKFLSNASSNSLDKKNNSTDTNTVGSITNGEISNNSKMGICMNRNLNNIEIRRCQSDKGQFANECLDMSHKLLMQCLDGL